MKLKLKTRDPNGGISQGNYMIQKLGYNRLSLFVVGSFQLMVKSFAAPRGEANLDVSSMRRSTIESGTHSCESDGMCMAPGRVVSRDQTVLLSSSLGDAYCTFTIT